MHKLLNEKIDEQVLLLGNEAIARGAVEAGWGLQPLILEHPLQNCR